MATLLPLPETTWVDQNGVPLAGGSVYFYVPGTEQFKDTYQDSAGEVLNTNPVILDAAGRAIVYGTGSYRQVVYDAAGNLQWDQVTADTAIGGLAWGGTSTGTPNAQVISASSFSQQDGQQISFIVGSGLTNTGATTIAPGGGGGTSILKDTTSGPTSLVGGEMVAGNVITVVYDAGRGAFHLVQNTNYALLGEVKTVAYTTPDPGYHMADGAALSRTTYAALFAKIGTVFGSGDGSTTFNVPNLLGEFVRGWNNTGSGLDPSRTFGSTQASQNLTHTHAANVTDPGHTHVIPQIDTLTGSGPGKEPTTGGTDLSVSTLSSTTGITVANVASGGSESRPNNIALMYEIYVGFPAS